MLLKKCKKLIRFLKLELIISTVVRQSTPWPTKHCARDKRSIELHVVFVMSFQNGRDRISHQRCSEKKGYFQKFRKIHMKIPVSESLFQ